MTETAKPPPTAGSDESHLAALGYSGQDFHRSMSLWSNMALGFTYLSPLVGVYSLFAYSLVSRRPAGNVVDRHRGLRPVPGGARVRRSGFAVPACRRHLPVDQEAVGPQVRVDRELGVPVGGHRDRDGRRGIRRRLHRRALRHRAHPNRPVDHRGRFAAVRVGGQLQRYAHARQSCQDRVGGGIDRRDRARVVSAAYSSGSTRFRSSSTRWAPVATRPIS